MQKDKNWLYSEIRSTYVRIQEETSLYKQLKSNYLGKMEKLFATAYQLTLNKDKVQKKDLKKEYSDLFESCRRTFLSLGECYTRIKCARDYLSSLKYDLHSEVS